jgi:hypothetical protein
LGIRDLESRAVHSEAAQCGAGVSTLLRERRLGPETREKRGGRGAAAHERSPAKRLTTTHE